MIKINLLLARKEKKKTGMRKEITVSLASGVVLLACLGVVQWKISKDVDDMRAKIAETKRQIAELKSLSTEVNQYKEAQKVLEDKLAVIHSLKRERSLPARVLDEVSVQKPEKMHLESLKKDGMKLGIEGVALDDETIANFMTNLRKTKLFDNVDLIVSEQTEISKLKLKKFTLSCNIISM